MWRAFAICAWLCCFSAQSAAQAPLLEPAEFAVTVTQALAAAFPDASLKVQGDMQLELHRPDGRRAMFGLGNIYNLYRQEPERLGELVRRFVAAAAESCDTCTARLDHARIVPVIKDRAWLEQFRARLKQQAGGKAPDPLYEDLNTELVIVYAENSDNRIRYLSSAEDIGLAGADLRRLAVDNLRRLLTKIRILKYDDMFARISAGGDYEASLLLVDEIWSGPQLKFDGEIVVAIPAKDILLVTGSKNRKGLKVVRQLAANFVQKESYALVDTLFVYRNGRFTKFGR